VPSFARLTLRSVEARAVLVPLKRPIVSKVGLYDAWPLILIDLHTEEGVVGRSYLEPYLERAARYLVPAILDLAEARKGRPVVPLDDFRQGRSSLGLVGLEGMSLIAVSGLDMAAWDALAKAAGMPLAAYLGGSPAPVPAYNSNGLWLTAPEGLGEEAAALPEAFGQPGRLLAAGAVLALILLPNSIAEELLFRGWAMSAITRRHGLLPAMVITSAAFGAAHVPPWEWAEPARLLSFVSYSAVGLAFAAMAVRTGSLYAPIAFHTGFNTLLITGAFADADFSPDRMLENITNSPLGTALISEAVVWLVVNLIFAALLVGWWRRRRT